MFALRIFPASKLKKMEIDEKNYLVKQIIKAPTIVGKCSDFNGYANTSHIISSLNGVEKCTEKMAKLNNRTVFNHAKKSHKWISEWLKWSEWMNGKYTEVYLFHSAKKKSLLSQNQIKSVMAWCIASRKIKIWQKKNSFLSSLHMRCDCLLICSFSMNLMKKNFRMKLKGFSCLVN